MGKKGGVFFTKLNLSDPCRTVQCQYHGWGMPGRRAEVTCCNICTSTMPRAQSRTAKGSTLMEDETLCPSGYIIYLWLWQFPDSPPQGVMTLFLYLQYFWLRNTFFSKLLSRYSFWYTYKQFVIINIIIIILRMSIAQWQLPRLRSWVRIPASYHAMCSRVECGFFFWSDRTGQVTKGQAWF